jgi:hypothetical protein
MLDGVPPGARAPARVLLLDGHDRLLLGVVLLPY